MNGSREEADGPGTGTGGSGVTGTMYRYGQLTEVGVDLLQDLVVLTQESPLAGDHLPECLCVSWFHGGQFVLLGKRARGPKRWTQRGRDGVKGNRVYWDTG